RAGAGPTILRDCACGGTCASCSTGNELIQRKAVAAPGRVDYAGLGRRAHGAGQALDRTTRSFMESRFGHGLDGVRVHTDDFASHQAQALGASAFTIGQDVFFGSGRYRPEMADGRRLIAHELVHTVQQRDRVARHDGLGPASVSRPGDALELEAERIADRVVGGSGAVGTPRATDELAIQRQGLPDIDLPSLGDLKRGAQALLEAGEGAVQRGAQAVKSVGEAAEEAIDWIATEAGQLALAEANALAGLFGGSVIIRKGCLVIQIPEITVFPTFQKTLGESPPVGFFVPLWEGGMMLGPIPIAGAAGLLGYAPT